MSTISPYPAFKSLNLLLNKTKSTFNASELHGLFCGIICTSQTQNVNWQSWVEGENQSKKLSELMTELFEKSKEQMASFSFDFQLLLPNDNDDINARVEALGLWCQGFLTGLDKNLRVTLSKKDDIKEALKDIIEIAQVNFGSIVQDEEDETAYFELAEYIRLVVLMIYQECHKKSQTITTNDKYH